MNKKITIGIVLLVFIGLTGCIDTENPNGEEGTVEYWTWELSANEPINITFTSRMINCTGSNKTEGLFASILNISGELTIFQEYPTGNWDSWVNNRPYNDLESIQPSIPCQVQAEKDCTLRIEKC